MTDLQDDVERDARTASAEAAMVAAGISTTEPVPEDYFGFEETLRIPLPDGVSWVEHKILNEGGRRKYLKQVNRDVKIQKHTGDALMRLSPGDEKVELLRIALCNWNLIRKGITIPFTQNNLNDFLEKASPRIIDLIDKEVKKANPWLLQEMTLEDIDREIASLQELRQAKVDEEEGKGVLNGR